MMRTGSALIVALVMALGSTAYAGQTYSLQVDGLACPFCAYGIEKQLTSLDGVTEVVVDLNAGAVRVIMKDGSILSEADAKQAVKDAGFTLKGFTSATN
jgi:copper chaperone CopZ